MTRSQCSAQASTDADVLSIVTRALDTLVLIGQQNQGLLPSVMDAATGQMFEQPPDPIVGQRQGDRARWGCNLMHDHPLLWTLLGMSEILGRTDYAQAVNRYLSRFTSHCVDTPSGLFPWGEHAYWRLDRDCFGNSNAEVGSDPSYPIIHDHLRAAPSWLWHRINALNPTCVQRYAHGLDYHFKFDEPTEFSRHACLMAGDPDLPDHKGYTAAGRPRRLTGPHDGANDFPRHSGFYAMDIAYAWSQSGDETLLPMLHRAADYWWLKRDGHCVLPLQSRGPDIQHHAPQTLSLALSLCEAADMLTTGPHKDTTLAASYRERAAYYIECCYADQTYDDRDALLHAKGRAWGGQYGARGYILCTYPNLFLGLYRQTGEQRLLDTAMLLSARIAATPLPNTNEMAMPATDIAMALMALVDLYVMTGGKCWYNDAMILGHQALTLYFQYDLPIGATGIHWYESQLGTSYLLYALAKLACLEYDLDITTMGFEISNR